MFRSDRKSDRKKESPESSEESPVISQCSINGGLYDYKFGVKEDREAQKEAMVLAKEIMGIIESRKIPYHIAMCLPDALHTLLQSSFFDCVFSAAVTLSPAYRDDQGDNRDDQRKD